MLQRRIVELIPDAGVFEEAVQMAFQARHTLADCLYLAAAKRINAPLITADGPMRDRGTRAYGNISILGGVTSN